MAGPLRTGDHVLDALHGGQRAADVAHHVHAVGGNGADAGEVRGHRSHPGEPAVSAPADNRDGGVGWSRESGVGWRRGDVERKESDGSEENSQGPRDTKSRDGGGVQTSNTIRALAAALQTKILLPRCKKRHQPYVPVGVRARHAGLRDGPIADGDGGASEASRLSERHCGRASEQGDETGNGGGSVAQHSGNKENDG
jgi:hypothetical protein